MIDFLSCVSKFGSLFFPCVVLPFGYFSFELNTHASKTLANSATWSAADDIDALITVEVLFVPPDSETGEQLQIANIQFNNLDIIGKLNFHF